MFREGGRQIAKQTKMELVRRIIFRYGDGRRGRDRVVQLMNESERNTWNSPELIWRRRRRVRVR